MTQRKEPNLIDFQDKDTSSKMIRVDAHTVQMGKKHQQQIVNHANIQGFHTVAHNFKVKNLYRSQMQPNWKQQLEGAYTVQRGKIGWRHLGNDGNDPRLAKLMIASASHSSMPYLMLPKLCQRNIKDAEGKKGTTVDQPTVAVAKGWDLKQSRQQSSCKFCYS